MEVRIGKKMSFLVIFLLSLIFISTIVFSTKIDYRLPFHRISEIMIGGDVSLDEKSLISNNPNGILDLSNFSYKVDWFGQEPGAGVVIERESCPVDEFLRELDTYL